ARAPRSAKRQAAQSTLVDRRAARAERRDEQQPADDREVLQQVVHLVRVLRGVELPEAVRGKGGNQHEEREHPGDPAGLPPDDEENRAAELDDDSEHREKLRRREAELGEVAHRCREAEELAYAGVEKNRANQDASGKQDERTGARCDSAVVHGPSFVRRIMPETLSRRSARKR